MSEAETACCVKAGLAAWPRLNKLPRNSSDGCSEVMEA